jgi:hypothetical protein
MFQKTQQGVNCRTIGMRVGNGLNQEDKNAIRFDLEVQRRGCWTLKQKQDLVDSLLFNFPVPPLYFVNKQDSNYWCLDGQQRTRAIAEFLSDEFTLSKDLSDYIDDDDSYYEIAGKKFSELPEEVKNISDPTTFNCLAIDFRESSKILLAFRPKL